MFARIDDNNMVVELLDYTTLEGRFHPDFIAACQECDGTIKIGWEWDGESFSEPAGPTLFEAKTALLESVQAEKCRVRDAGFDVGGIHFDSDSAARLSYLEFAMKLGADHTFSTPWKANDAGDWVTMDATLYANVAAAGEQLLSDVFAWQAAKQIEIEAATTVAEVEAIEVTYVVS